MVWVVFTKQSHLKYQQRIFNHNVEIPSKTQLLTKATNENLVNSFKRFKWSHLNEKDPNSLKLELDYEVLGKSIFYIYESDSYELNLVDRFLSIKGVSLC